GLEARRWILRNADEHVGRPLAELLAGRDVRHLPARHVHGDERIQIDVGVDADGVRLLLRHGGLAALRECGRYELREEKAQRQSNASAGPDTLPWRLRGGLSGRPFATREAPLCVVRGPII